jgi:hypothetical protein
VPQAERALVTLLGGLGPLAHSFLDTVRSHSALTNRCNEGHT